MFSVPGWNLAAAAPAAQVDPAAAKKPRKKKQPKSASGGNEIALRNPRGAANAAAATEKPAKPPPSTGPQVTKENVTALYEKVIEGGGKKKRVRESKAAKKVRLATKAEAAAAEEAEVDGGDKKHDKKKSKKRAAEDAPADGAASSPSAAKKAKKSQPAAAATAPADNTATLTPMQQKMRAKLSSARFRHINETLYTKPSTNSLELFAKQPDLYQEYHTGFRQQVQVWPENPVDIFIAALRERARIPFVRGHSKKVSNVGEHGANLPLPCDKDSGVCTVADLGCGDAAIAAAIAADEDAKKKKKPQQKKHKPEKGVTVKVLSFDLAAATPAVTVADIAHLPLADASVDIAIFCLALMGTNYLDFVAEAFRVLRPRGELWVTEIKSRFAAGGHPPVMTEEEAAEAELTGKAEIVEQAVYRPFVAALQKRGFTPRGKVDAANKMFVRMEFVKLPDKDDDDDDDDDDEKGEEGVAIAKGRAAMGGKAKKKKIKFIEADEDPAKILKPCLYKTR